MRNLGLSSSLALCAGLLALSGSVGCGDDEPSPNPDATVGIDATTPRDAGRDASVSDGGDAATNPDSAVDAGDTDGGGPDANTTTTIGPNGGEVDIGGASVTIPAGALSAEEEIGIAEVTAPVALPTDYLARSPIYAFTPHGLAFSSSVSINLAYQDTADTVLRLADASDTTWEPVAGGRIGVSSTIRPRTRRALGFRAYPVRGLRPGDPTVR